MTCRQAATVSLSIFQQQIENLGWKVETTERRGIAVVWIPLADPLMRANIENTIMASKCRPKAATD
jgi:hypothetical protein